jgi:pimeloyl-ACP methyl ester carboxylesterase
MEPGVSLLNHPHKSAATCLLAGLILGLSLPVAAAGLSDMPAGKMIDEPVFQGQAQVYETGPAGAEAVVLIHGIGDNAARDWSGLIPLLAREYRVLTFDLPGFGQSTAGNKLYSPEKYVEFVRHVTRTLQRPFYLVGHSLGGAIALRYAASYPQDVKGLVIADVPGILHRLSYSQYLSHLGIGMVPDFYPNQKEQLHNLVGNVLGFAEKLSPDLERVIANPTLRETMLGSSPAKIAGLALVLDDFSNIIDHVQVPVLVVWGAKDDLASMRTARVLVANIPQARLEVLANSGHTPMEDMPTEFNALVTEYLHNPQMAGSGMKDRIRQKAGVRSQRNASCKKNRNIVFEGEYDIISIVDCRDVVIRNASARMVRVTDASVTIEHSYIGGDDGGLRLDDANLIVTGSVIEAPVAIKATDSRLDLAGVTLLGGELALRAPYRSRVLFSVSYIRSPKTKATAHGMRVVGPDNPL